MSKSVIRSIATSTALGALLALGGCGGGSASSDSDLPGTGSLSLAITDAPVDNVQEVWVEFTGVSVKPASGPAIDFTFDQPVSVDLLTLTGENTTTLLNNAEVPAGDYEWILLRVNAEFDSVYDSYVVEDMGGMVELRVPSGSEQGLRLVSGFAVVAGGSASFVIDWDLLQALTAPVGQPGYYLRPALRITDMAQYGTIAGAVADLLVMDESCANDLAEDRGNLVYVYQGSNVVPADISGGDMDPFATAKVAQDQTAAGAYTYAASFLPPGDYTVAFTCQGMNEDPMAEDGLLFVGTRNATVVHDQETTVDF